MTAENSSVLAYPCPHCQIMLEPPAEPWQGWVRCPQCGQPGLPPEGLRLALRRKRTTASGDQAAPKTEGQSQMTLSSTGAVAPGAGSRLKEPSWTPRPPGDGLRKRSVSSAGLLIAGTGLAVSAFLLLVAWLDRNLYRMMTFGGLAGLFLVSILTLPRRRKGTHDVTFQRIRKPPSK